MTESNDIKVRCSKLGDLFTNARTKKAQEEGQLSETSKTLVRDLWLANELQFREPVATKQMIKGLTQEQDSMKLASSVLGGFRMRYAEQLQNEFLTGTPDIVLEDCVEDIKTSWNIRTFMNAELSKAYERQLQGYMMLTGMKQARLIYCLIPTSEDQVREDCKSFWFKYGQDSPDYLEAERQLYHNNNIITRIPEENRVKVFEIERDEAFVDEVKARVENVRKFYESLTL
jgi:hypothetical protein